jgi:thiol-disulfide isomerase/thioredoxin
LRPAAPVALLVALLVALTGCSGLQSTGDKGFVSADGKVEQVAAADRGDPVTLQGQDLDGHDVSVADFRGKPVVVVVWGSWCSPCRAEAPGVVEAAKELDGKAQFVGLNIRDASVDQARGFVRTFDVPYPSIYSPDGKGMLAFSGSLPPQAIPSFAVLDDEGRVAAVIPGQLPSKTTLVELTEDVAAEGSAGSGGNADG